MLPLVDWDVDAAVDILTRYATLGLKAAGTGKRSIAGSKYYSKTRLRPGRTLWQAAGTVQPAAPEAPGGRGTSDTSLSSPSSPGTAGPDSE